MSNLITLNNGIAAISENEWAVVTLPASQVEERKQAGKVVLFKLTGEKLFQQNKLPIPRFQARAKSLCH